MRGGYKLVDLNGHALTTGEALTIKGIYESIEGNYHKMTVVTGLTLDNVELNDTPVTLVKSGNEFKGLMNPQIAAGKLAVLEVTIANTDTITITKHEIAGA